MRNMVSTGKAFENKIRNWHKDIDCITFKYPDHASSGTTQKAICDRVTITSNGVYWFECKHTESRTSFNLNLIKPHQWDIMTRLHNFHQEAYFLIEDGRHCVYMINATMLKVIGNDKKSIKFGDINFALVSKKRFQSILK